MNVIQVSWSDRHGGAAIAASRLNDALNRHGVASQMLSISGLRDDRGVLRRTSALGRLADRVSARLDRLPLRSYPANPSLFSPAVAPERTLGRISRANFDIAHLHWINNGFLKIEHIGGITRPLVWTLHDMWAFTGGCHYSAACERYLQDCGACPQLSSSQLDDLSRDVVRRKARAWSNLNMTVVTPSRWLAGLVKSSRVLGQFPVEVIPNCIDTGAFAPQDRAGARAAFGLPSDAFILLFGAIGTDDRRKGFHLLEPALRELSSRSPSRRFHLAVFGTTEPSRRPDLPFPVRFLGPLSNARDVARAYSCADVFVVPSLEDNLPNTVMEASSCGVPSVAFGIGGLPDLILDRETGVLARPFDPIALAAGILWLAEDDDRLRSVGAAARRHVMRSYELQVVAGQYARVYQQLLARSA